jgi:hypothetical protein
MHNVPESEARALLARPLFCLDADDWVPVRTQPTAQFIEGGLLDEEHARVGLQVQLLVHVGPKTKITKYKFTVFQNYLGDLRRVYQLHIQKLPKITAHDYPHQHMGDLRLQGSDGWLGWDYADALTHFCAETNITFMPGIGDPGEFRLRPT